MSNTIGLLAGTFKNLDSAALESATKIGLSFKQAFGVDVQESIMSAQTLITGGLATDVNNAFDLMTKASQGLGPAMAGELPGIVDAYGTAFSTMGFSGQQAFSFIIANGKQGKEILDHAGDSVKELSIRMSEMDDATAGALGQIGADATQMASAIAQGGAPAQAALQQIANGLLGVQDPAQRAQLAMQIFGDPLTELGANNIPTFLQSLTGVAPEMQNVAGSAQQMTDALGDNAASKLESLKNTIQTGIVTALIASADWMSRNKEVTIALAIAVGTFVTAIGIAKLAAAGFAIAQGISAAATGAGTVAIATNSIAMGAYAVATGVMRAATAAGAVAQWAFNAALAANPIGLIVIAIAALVAGLVWFFTQTELGRHIWETVWGAIKAVLQGAWDFIKGIWDALVGSLVWIGQKFEEFKVALGIVWDAVKDGVGVVVGWITDKWNAFIDFFTGLPGRIGAAAAGLWDWVKDGFKSAINWLIEKWNNFSLGFDFTIPIIDKHVSFHVDTPDIPLFDEGGWTGNGSKRDVAGVVHADEFVVNKAARRSFEGAHPGALDTINATGALPGYMTGGRVKVLKPDATIDGSGGSSPADSSPVLVTPSAPVSPNTSNAISDTNTSTADSATTSSPTPNAADTSNTKTVNATSGSGPLEAWAGEDNLKPIAVLVRRMIHRFWPAITDIGGYRAQDPYPDHPSGRALDIMTSDIDLGTTVKDWLHANKSPLALNYTIWQQYYQPANGEGNLMEDRGSTTQNHKDHIHALFDPLDVDPSVIPAGVSLPAGASASNTPTVAPTVAPQTDSKSSALSTSTQSPSTATASEPKQTTQQKIASSFSENLGNAAKSFVSGQFSDLLGVFGANDSPAFLKAAGEFQTAQEENQKGQQSSATATPSTTSTPSTPTTPQATTSTPTAPQRPGGRDGYSFDITKAAKDMTLDKAAAVIGNATALVESEMKMYANSNVPESLNLPHDAVGSDNDSVGLFQQRPSWGPITSLMDSYKSAGLFYDALKGVPGWESMDPGAAAQAVQRSAYPGKYSGRMGEADELVKKAGIYDQGGWLQPGLTLVENNTNKPEAVLNPAQWAQFAQMAEPANNSGNDGPPLVFNVQGYEPEAVARAVMGKLGRAQMRFGRAYAPS